MEPGTQPIDLLDATSAIDLDHVRALFRAYAAEHAPLIGEALAAQGFEAEVAGLPGKYAPPGGCLLLAVEGDRPVGTVALRPCEGDICERKRLYVDRAFRGRGIGRLLVSAILDRAKRAGYRRMRLDSVPELGAAVAMYRSFGFVPTAPYGENPTHHTVFLERNLGDETP
jgi:GNAT superfamily N-acetyltransferase